MKFFAIIVAAVRAVPIPVGCAGDVAPQPNSAERVDPTKPFSVRAKFE